VTQPEGYKFSENRKYEQQGLRWLVSYNLGDMSAWQQQMIDDLRQRIGACLQRRAALQGAYSNPADANSRADQIRRIDGDIAEAARALADAERKLKVTP
jgi:hypothetical protein